jgi:hypothetical protein
MPDAAFIADMIARGELAVAEVQRDLGYDPCEPMDPVPYIEALEAKVREQAMTLYLAARTPIEAGRITP